MKVTGNQLFWMIMIMDLGMTLMMTLTSGFQAAKQDTWMSVLVAGCVALLIAALSTNLAKLYPGQTLIQYSQTIMGPWLGKIVCVIYFVQWYTIIPIVLRQFCDVIQMMLLPETPKIFIIMTMTLVVGYAVYTGGIDGVGRYSEILGPLVVLMILVVLLASANNIRWENLLPVYADSGIKAIVKGALPSASYLGHAVEYVMLAAFLYVPQKGPRHAYWAVTAAVFCVWISTVMITLTLGANLSSKMWYPFFEMTKKISLFRFIENLDAIVVVIWLFSVFIKLAIYKFVTCYGTAQFLQIRNWKPLVWIEGAIATVYALIPKNIVQATSNYLLHYWIPVALYVNMIGLPLLLLIVGKIRLGKQKAANAGPS
jgi:spore germination protein KB